MPPRQGVHDLLVSSWLGIGNPLVDGDNSGTSLRFEETREEQVMANGDNLVLGELQNSATSMTRLVGRVDDNFAFRVDQEGTGGHGAIMTIGKIHGFGLDSSPVRGGTGVEGQGGKGLPGEL